MSTRGQFTRLLRDAAEGHLSAADDLMPLVYDELRALAGSLLNLQPKGHTLQPTALVSEAYLKLVGQERPSWSSRAHFYGVAAKAMRHILVNHAKSKGRQKRGGGWQRVTLADLGAEDSRLGLVELLDLDEAMKKLEMLDERQCSVVELRFFGGLSVEETAKVLEVSPRTVELDWRMARAWLVRTLRGDAQR
jgi:RNA polymerase sigma factor (TIGR02999 family)